MSSQSGHLRNEQIHVCIRHGESTTEVRCRGGGWNTACGTGPDVGRVRRLEISSCRDKMDPVWSVEQGELVVSAKGISRSIKF